MSPQEILRRARERKSAAEVSGILTPPKMSASEALRRMQTGNVETTTKEPVITEAMRILALPTWDRDTLQVDLTEELKTPRGTMKLNRDQSLALHFARQVKGLVGPLAVGTGKALITFLLPRVMGARRPLLLIPSDMHLPTNREINKMKEHWRLPLDTLSGGFEPLRILPYSQLSTAKSTDVLDRLMPDLIIADEVQNLRYPSSARTKRVIRYFKQFPATMFAGLSGTYTSRGLRDYAHLVELALRNFAPLPLNEDDLIAWANVIDAKVSPRPQDIRCFEGFCPDLDSRVAEEIENPSHAGEGDDEEITDEHIAKARLGGRGLFSETHQERQQAHAKAFKRAARGAFRERFNATPGVVATREGSVACSLVMRLRDLDLPEGVAEALDDLDHTWCRPDGEELVSGLDFWRCAGQLAQGFYYRWVWPGGIVDTQWLERRAAWHREVRQVLTRSIVGLDSPLLVTRAVMDVRLDAFGLEDREIRGLLRTWNDWSEVKHKPRPPTETVWLDDFLFRDALRWHKEHPKGLIWFDDLAMEQKFRAAGIETYGSGEDPPEDGRGMALSINAFKAGRNLQRNSESLWLSFPSSGLVCEQCLGRTHRQGQEADEVSCWYYAHTKGARKAIIEAKKLAEYIQDSQGSPQKLLYATWS